MSTQDTGGQTPATYGGGLERKLGTEHDVQAKLAASVWGLGLGQSDASQTTNAYVILLVGYHSHTATSVSVASTHRALHRHLPVHQVVSVRGHGNAAEGRTHELGELLLTVS